MLASVNLNPIKGILPMSKKEIDLLTALIGDLESQFGIDPERDQATVLRYADRGFPCLQKMLHGLEDEATAALNGNGVYSSLLFRELAKVSLPSVRVLSGFLTKLDTGLVQPKLIAEAELASKQNEARLSSIRTEGRIFRYLNDFSKSFLYEDLAPELDDLVPRHSSGAVAEGLSSLDKFSCDCCIGLYEIDASFFGKLSRADRHAPTSARFFCVPKNASKLRAISIEPAARQYLQQGARRILHKYLRSTSVGKWIHDADQTVNFEASHSAGCATIDMSNASDSVRCSHVYTLFSRWKWFRRFLFATRSPKLAFNTGLLPLVRYAGMGNATTFLVESICFLAIARGAILDVASVAYDRSVRRRARRCADGLRVYGDDIVVPDSAFAGCVVSALRDAGYIVNATKTCIAGSFRESCGAEWYNGIDIRIPRLRRPISHYVAGSGMELEVLVDRLRRWSANQTLRLVYGLLDSDPYSQYKMFGKHQRDMRLVYNRDTQSCEFRGLVASVVNRKVDGEDGKLRYFTSGSSVVAVRDKGTALRLVSADVLSR